jgi:hypothetical protein
VRRRQIARPESGNKKLRLGSRGFLLPYEDNNQEQQGLELLQHRCLQTSCCVVQLRLQALVAAAGFVAAAEVVGTHEFWHNIACVSQLV